jgi:hypothetical protein
MNKRSIEITRENLLRIARIVGPSSAATAALADMDRIEAEGDFAVCVRQGKQLVVIRIHNPDQRAI